MEGEDRREWAVETGRRRAEGGTGRAETESVESVACVLVPSPVRPLSAGDLWHQDWEQSPLPALYCYYWQLMRPDGLSSTALNRGLHLHESRDLLFPFFPISSFYFLLHGGSGVLNRTANFLRWKKEGRADRDVWARVCSCCTFFLLHAIRPVAYKWRRDDELHPGKWLTSKYSALKIQPLITWPQAVFDMCHCRHWSWVFD